MKNTQNCKDTKGMLQNMHILLKILYRTLAKIVKIVEIHEKALKNHSKNHKDTEGTLQNLVKIYQNFEKHRKT